MSASGKRCHVPARDDLVARSLFVFYLGLVVVFGLAGAWTKPPNPDEASFYLPAFKWIWGAFPRLSLDYPLPELPTTLYFQTLTFGVSGQDVGVVRGVSSIAMLTVAGFLLLGPLRHPTSTLRQLRVLVLLCNPFLFWNAFTAKGHAIAVSALLAGVAAWQHLGTATRSRYVIIAVGGLAVAGTSNQLALPVCVGLLATEAFATVRRLLKHSDGRSPNGHPCSSSDAFPVAPGSLGRGKSFCHQLVRGGGSVLRGRLLAPALPLFAASALFAFWGGFSPPSYGVFIKEKMGGWGLEAEVGRFSNPLPCVALLLITVGAWLSPMILQFRRRQMLTLLWLAWPLAAVLVEVSGLYRPGGSFLAVAAGPLSTVLRWASGDSHWLLVLGAGFMAALGLLILLPDFARAAPGGRAAQITLLCCIGAAAGVPYLFESYSLYAITGIGALLLTGEVGEHRIARVHAAAVAGAGVVYAAVKLFAQ
jgi:hypothetical protein